MLPRIFQILAMEWFYRFLKEPKRLFRRYFIDDIQFFLLFCQTIIGALQRSFCIVSINYVRKQRVGAE